MAPMDRPKELVTRKQLDAATAALTALLRRAKRDGFDPLARLPRITIGEKDGEPVFVIKHPPRVN